MGKLSSVFILLLSDLCPFHAVRRSGVIDFDTNPFLNSKVNYVFDIQQARRIVNSLKFSASGRKYSIV